MLRKKYRTECGIYRGMSLVNHTGMPHKIVLVTMWVCARLNDGEGSGWFPACFDNFVGEMRVTYTRFEAVNNIVDALVDVRNKTGAGVTNGRRASPGDVTMRCEACSTLMMPESSRNRLSRSGKLWSGS